MATGSGGPVGAKTKKVSGSSTGANGGPYKKDGYARGPVPKTMIGSKNGLADKPGPFGKGYSGPDVQKGQFP